MKNNVSYSGYAHMNRRHFVAAGAVAAIGRAEDPLDAVYQHIDRNLPAHIERIQQYVRQPSISA